MIITGIELENFMCYSGPNSIPFTEGLNVVIGDNNYGKSKLYDAFYWALYDKVFVSEQKTFIPTSEVRGGIISDKAKFEVEDGPISAIVRLTFKNSTRGQSYIIERKYTITKKDGQFVERRDSEQTIWQKELDYLDAKIVTNETDKERILKLVLPENIKPYMWFQGEQVESIIDFNQQDTLNRAINVLSSISEFDDMIEIAEAASQSARTEYNRQAKLLSKDKQSSEALEKEREELNSQLENLVKEENSAKDNLARAEAASEALLAKSGDANKIRDLKLKRNNLKSELETLQLRIREEEIGFHKKVFKNKWLLKFTEPIFVRYSDKYRAYEVKKLEKKAAIKAEKEAEDKLVKKLQTRLPIDIPAPIYVQHMLDQERCLVCDREAIENSEPWLKIQELLHKPSDSKEAKSEQITKHDFNSEFKKIYDNGLALSHNIASIDADIEETITYGLGLKRKVRDISTQYAKIEAEIKQALADSSMEGDDPENITNEYAIQTDYVRRFSLDLNNIVHRIENVKNKLSENKAKMQNLTKGDIPGWLVDKVTVLEQFEEIAHSTRNRVFNKLIERLEAEANVHYKSMTSNNRGIQGIIKLVKKSSGNYMPQLEDDNGNKLMQLNTSNIILIKLATIMAIISARQGQSTSLYTLITDAPASVFGENYTIGFCKTVSQVYTQSIIMSKEFYNNQDLRNELLNNKDIRLGKVYLLNPTISEAERVNRNTLATNIKPLN